MSAEPAPTADQPPAVDMVKGISRIIGAANQAALNWEAWTRETR